MRTADEGIKFASLLSPPLHEPCSPGPPSNETAYASSSKSSCFSLHLTSFKYFDFNKVSRNFDQSKKGSRLQRGIQATEKENQYHLNERIRKNLTRWTIERGIPAFSNTGTKPSISATSKQILGREGQRKTLFIYREQGARAPYKLPS